MKKRRPRTSAGPAAATATSRDTLKWWLALIGAVLSLTGTSVGVMRFFDNKESDRAKTDLESSYRNKQIELEVDYQKRLRSIELRLGDKEDYFDVAQMVIPPAAVYELPSSARRFQLAQNIEFYVDDYPSGEWQFVESDELRLLEIMVGRQQALKEAAEMGLADELGRAKIYLFKYPAGVAVDFSRRRRNPDAAQRMNFVPIVLVQPIEHTSISQALSLQKGQVADALLDRFRANDPFTLLTRDQVVARILADTFRGDLAGYTLKSLIDQGFKYVEDYERTTFQIVSLQKVQNIVFLQSRLIIEGPYENASDPNRHLQVEELAFFFSGIDRSFFVRAYVPITSSDSPHVAWVKRFLTGIRIVWG